ncbi:MAG: hypothetical protein ABIV26_09735 [Candidatus Limnocylindrales bacterium]
MRELGTELLLRFGKVIAATLIGVLIHLIATGPLGGAPSAELWLLSWLCGAAAVLLLESGVF